MNYDPTSMRWLTSSDVQAEFSPSLRGHDLTPSLMPTPPAECWGTLRFRPWRQADAPVYATLLSDPDLWRYMPHITPGQLDLEQARALIAIAQDRRRHLVRAVLRKGVPVGQVRLHWQGSPKPLAKVELDYWLDKSVHGAGVGTRMVALFLWQTLRDFPHLQLVTVVIHRDNAPSRHLARRLGFVESGPKEQGSPWIEACMTRQIAARIDWGGLIRRKTEQPVQRTLQS
jgi:RimJ/RimL family protein N-acetyltransferase